MVRPVAGASRISIPDAVAAEKLFDSGSRADQPLAASLHRGYASKWVCINVANPGRVVDPWAKESRTDNNNTPARESPLLRNVCIRLSRLCRRVGRSGAVAVCLISGICTTDVRQTCAHTGGIRA
ncbi:hypothetical protein CMUS01_01963 [Colletotrichum musicola]|uniref:Uncharacterized protein n=1 Tax=Colletotrichum musicola TaxID=2175873 RepID=A0A8H6U877_9PEZI|nr:hypothetical protein CMUS01_01963 [Colletotrichum musicola]